MNSLFDDARGMLDKTGYATYAARPDDLVLHFEDNCLLGFVRVFDDPELIISMWRHEQDSFLRLNASSLVHDPVKAWNLYAVFLTRAPTSEKVARALFALEEDFQSMRKIARGDIRTHDALAVVLGPLLPIQTRLSLDPADLNARLLERFGPADSPRRLLMSDVPPEDIARLLSE